MSSVDQRLQYAPNRSSKPVSPSVQLPMMDSADALEIGTLHRIGSNANMVEGSTSAPVSPVPVSSALYEPVPSSALLLPPNTSLVPPSVSASLSA